MLLSIISYNTFNLFLYYEAFYFFDKKPSISKDVPHICLNRLLVVWPV